MQLNKRALQWWALVVIILGFSLRICNLGTFGFWVDEAATGFISRLSIKDIIVYTKEHSYEHPPLYYAILHLWLQIAGDTEWPSRFFAVFWGTLALAVAFSVFLRLASPLFSIFSLLYLALNPFHLAYSQENRMYGWLSFLGAFSILALLKFIRNSSKKWLALYIIAGVLGIFSHYFFLLFPIAHLAYALTLALSSKEKRFIEATLTIGIVLFILGIALGLWLLISPGPFSMLKAELHQDLSPLIFWELWKQKLRKVLVDIVVSEPREPVIPTPILLCTLALWLLVTWASTRGILTCKPNELFLLLVFSLYIPLVEMSLIPHVIGRHFIYLALPFAFFLTLGLKFLWKSYRFAFILSIVLLVATLGYGYKHIYTVPKGDFKLAAAYISANSRPGDAVLITHPHAIFLALYYLQDAPISLYILPESIHHPTPQEIEEKVPSIFKGHQRLWLGPVDPGTLDVEGLIERWLSSNAFQVEKKWFPQSSYVALYLPPIKLYLPLVMQQWGNLRLSSDSFGFAVEEPHNFGDLVQLRAAYLDTLQPNAGSGIRILLHWRILKKTNDYIMISIKLQDQDGQVWAVRLSPMQGGLLPSQNWQPEQEVDDRHGLWINECTPPGKYRLVVGLYNVTSGTNIKVEGQDYLEIAKVEVKPGPLVTPAVSINLRFGSDLILLGADQWPREMEQGATFPVSLYWLPQAPPQSKLFVNLELRDKKGRTKSSSKHLLGVSWYPIEKWEPGICVKSIQPVQIPGRLAPGRYSLYGTIVTEKGTAFTPESQSSSWRLGTVEVRAIPRSFRKPYVANPFEAKVEGVAKLLGYELDASEARPGGRLRLTLFWQATGEPEISYTVFTHLLGPDGKMWGQKDNPPAKGSRPTTTWVKGEYIADEYTIPVHPEAPEGTYTLYVGFYNPQTMERLPAFGANGERFPSDAIPIAKVELARK
jgi:hypothetical protein